jgi:hypothetical protein
MSRCTFFSLILLAAVIVGVFGNRLMRADEKDAAESQPTFSKDKVEFFEKKVLPLLKANCFKCHGAEPKLKGNLKLTSHSGLLKGGDIGPAVDLKDLASSELLSAINYDGLEMPPTAKLKPDQIAVLTKWVKDGAAWTTTKDYGVETVHEVDKRGDGKDYWAYQAIKRPETPKVKNDRWVSNPIDGFLLAQLEAAKLKPNDMADKVALIRRAFYNLTGLPPTPQQIDDFVKDDSPKAWENVVDRLLDSPQYGERWGRHWLDIVRYAETHGYERDSSKPHAWRYRDYVINSFNKDKPYDQFVIEQLAGDEVPNVTAETLTATGFYRLGIWDDEPADRLLAKYNGLDDVLKTTTEAVLGMSMGCARCHSHKGDPIDHTEYYGMLAYFHDVTNMNRDNLRSWVTEEDKVKHEQVLKEKREREGQMYAQIYSIEQDFLVALKNSGESVGYMPQSDLEDVTYKFYRNTWDTIPNFEEFKHETEGKIASDFISLQPASRNEAIGFVYDAKLKVPAAGDYEFVVESTDGARLILDRKIVAERLGKGAGRVEGRTTLKAGLIPLRVEYFNTNAKPRLSIRWSGAQVRERFLTDDKVSQDGPAIAADSRKQGQRWKYSTSKPKADWQQPKFDDAKWKQGEGGFGTRGTPGSVVRTEWGTPDIWMRRKFNVAEIPPVLALDLHYDEDCEIYLNGNLIHSTKGYVQNYLRVALSSKSRAFLKKGENVLAVHCHQTGGGQYIDVGLVAAAGQFEFAQAFRQFGPKLLGDQTTKKHANLTRELDQSRKKRAQAPGTPIMSVREGGTSPVHVLIRGNPHVKGQQVQPVVPAMLSTKAPNIPKDRTQYGTSGRRLAFARWMFSEDNPLTARVMMNRLWQNHFGRGIVPTPNDFGKFGERPTNPELLDWLAAEFVEGGWKIKRMHKLLMMSSAYQMSSKANADGLKIDPANHKLWRFNMRRLSAEEIRDSVLAVTGELNLKAGGPSIYVPIAREVLQGQSVPGAGWGKSSPEEASRRSIYIHVKRSLIVPVLEMFDQADTDSSCPVRYITTVPTQSLGMLNGDFTNEKAVKFAERLIKDAPGDIRNQIRLAIRLTAGRNATEKELNSDVEFVTNLQGDEKLSREKALAVYCLLAINTNEFVYLD